MVNLLVERLRTHKNCLVVVLFGPAQLGWRKRATRAAVHLSSREDSCCWGVKKMSNPCWRLKSEGASGRRMSTLNPLHSGDRKDNMLSGRHSEDPGRLPLAIAMLLAGTVWFIPVASHDSYAPHAITTVLPKLFVLSTANKCDLHWIPCISHMSVVGASHDVYQP